MAAETLNEAVRAHEIDTDWTFQRLAATLYEWRDRFADVFFGDLPVIFLNFEPLRRRTLAHYLGGRNGVAALHEVTLNTRYLEAPDTTCLPPCSTRWCTSGSRYMAPRGTATTGTIAPSATGAGRWVSPAIPATRASRSSTATHS
jgi:hypothetical protein